jgi:hypothetical protein
MKKLNRNLKSALVAGVFAGIILGFSPRAGANPLIESQERHAETVKEKYLGVARELQIGLEDNLLSIDEQNKISNSYALLRTFDDLFCPDIDVTSDPGIYQQIGRYANLLEKNVNGLDLDQPELEKEFHRRGLPEVEVERSTSHSERTGLGILGLCAVTGSLISYIKRKR